MASFHVELSIDVTGVAFQQKIYWDGYEGFYFAKKGYTCLY